MSNSLARLANAVKQPVVLDYESEAVHTDQLSRLLNELSSTISEGNGSTAPGTSAATRAAINEDISLTIDEQRVLARALDELDDPALWHQVPQSLDQLSSTLERTGNLE